MPAKGPLSKLHKVEAEIERIEANRWMPMHKARRGANPKLRKLYAERERLRAEIAAAKKPAPTERLLKRLRTPCAYCDDARGFVHSDKCPNG